MSGVCVRPRPAADLDGSIVRASAISRPARHATVKSRVTSLLMEWRDTHERLELRVFDEVPADNRAIEAAAACRGGLSASASRRDPARPAICAGSEVVPTTQLDGLHVTSWQHP
jgi:hypothetical protein